MPVFDASQHAPQQAGPKHPPGNKFPATVTVAEIADTKDSQGKMFVITFTTPAGSIVSRYNLWNTSQQATKIAVGQLSALCHATGIFKVNFDDNLTVGPNGKELIGGKCLIDVGFQSGQEPSAEKPEGGYVEVKKIYDVNGNEPGSVTAQPQTSGFAQQQPKQEANKPEVKSGWGGGEPAKTDPNPAGNAGGWQPGNATAQKPPWG